MEAEQPLTAVCGLDDMVRRRLYDYVSGRAEPVGRDQAAAATGIGRPLAAYHLDRLVSLGLLTAGYRRMSGRQGPGAGRPAKVYARSQTEFAVALPPREYELAARLLVRAVEADPSGSARAGLRPAADEDGSLSLRNCPFHRLAVRHREVVCAMNLALLEGVTAGIGAGHELRPELDPAPGRCCVVVRAAAGLGNNPLERHDP